MPSIHDVARHANVSVGTVSRVINGDNHVTALTRRRVQKVITALDYRPNPAARALRSNRTRLIALTLPDFISPFYAAIVEGVQQILELRGFRLVLCGPQGRDRDPSNYLDMLIDRHVDGLILVSQRSSPNEKEIKELIRLGMKGYPIISLGQDSASGPRHFDSIVTDISSGVREAMQHLVELGHREIAYFGPPPGAADIRREVLESVIVECGIYHGDVLIYQSDATAEDGFRLAEELLGRPRRPTAIMAVNDMVAIGAMAALQEHGVSIPEEMSIIGIDDLPFTSIVRPRLTSVSQPKQELGRLAAERLLGRIQEDIKSFRVISLRSHLIVRESTTRPPSPSRSHEKVQVQHWSRTASLAAGPPGP